MTEIYKTQDVLEALYLYDDEILKSIINEMEKTCLTQ